MEKSITEASVSPHLRCEKEETTIVVLAGGRIRGVGWRLVEQWPFWQLFQKHHFGEQYFLETEYNLQINKPRKHRDTRKYGPGENITKFVQPYCHNKTNIVKEELKLAFVWPADIITLIEVHGTSLVNYCSINIQSFLSKVGDNIIILPIQRVLGNLDPAYEKADWLVVTSKIWQNWYFWFGINYIYML